MQTRSPIVSVFFLYTRDGDFNLELVQMLDA